MKKLHLISIILLLGLLQLNAQYQISEPEQEASQQGDQRTYLGIGTGINSNCGIAGVLVEIPIQNGFSINGGVGLGGWGLKTSLGFRYHPSYPYKMYYGLSFTSAGGAAGVPIQLTTSNSSEDPEEVLIDLERANNLAFAIGYDVPLGRVTRLNLEFGYSLLLGSDLYEVVDPNVVLTKTSESVMHMMTPGGIILGLGLTFSIGG